MNCLNSEATSRQNISKHFENVTVECFLNRLRLSTAYSEMCMIHRDYYMAIFISYRISTRDIHISPRSFGPRADKGRGLISGMILKLPYQNRFAVFFLTRLPI